MLASRNVAGHRCYAVLNKLGLYKHCMITLKYGLTIKADLLEVSSRNSLELPKTNNWWRRKSEG